VRNSSAERKKSQRTHHNPQFHKPSSSLNCLRDPA
jgi:hypothetical protein